MYIVLLKFSDNKNQAAQFMDGHKGWLQKGFEDGVFLLAGSLSEGLGGAILAQDSSRDTLVQRVGEDPFVVEKIVIPEIIELSPSRADERLSFLIN